MNYVRFLMNGIREHVRNACFTLLTTEEATEHSNYRGLVADFPDILDVRVAPAVTEENRLFRALGSFYERQWKHAEAFARGFEKIGPANVDFALLPHLEAVGLLHLALRRGLFRGTPGRRIPTRYASITGKAGSRDRFARLTFCSAGFSGALSTIRIWSVSAPTIPICRVPSIIPRSCFARIPARCPVSPGWPRRARPTAFAPKPASFWCSVSSTAANVSTSCWRASRDWTRTSMSRC